MACVDGGPWVTRNSLKDFQSSVDLLNTASLVAR